ncbi:hypothetical protein J4Q44_G00361330 [Coregonus suidteri]|uniref:Uncharacterized protein n=1 Tax=Coregonus suidteri TaxID=861788 RepID=A0AAN8KJW2_9TELE
MIESVEFIEDDHRLYQRAEEEDEDACSSLYLSEEGVIDNREVYQTCMSHYHDSQSLYHDPKTIYQDTHFDHQDPTLYHDQPHSPTHYHDQPHSPTQYHDQPHSLTTSPNPTSPTPIPSKETGTVLMRRNTLLPSTNTPLCPPNSPHGQEEERCVRVSRSNLSHPSPGTHSDPSPRRGAPILGERRDASLSLEGLELAGVADSSIFDYCQTSEVESDAETLHKSADEGDRGVGSLGVRSRGRGGGKGGL